MTTLLDTLRMALEAIQMENPLAWEKLTKQLRTQIKLLENAKPVAYLWEHKSRFGQVVENGVIWAGELEDSAPNDSWIPLYTHPVPTREWQGLSDREIASIYCAPWATSAEYARAIEAKLKEKNI